MSFLEALILGLVQGTTEFLPISSSAHLVLIPWWLGWDVPSLEYDVAVHIGTTIALLVYFWRDWLILLKAGWEALRRRALAGAEDRLLFYLIVGTIPAAILGVLLEDYYKATLSDPPLVAIQLLITAALLIFSEWYARANKPLADMTLPEALFIGTAQAVAIVPGISRSGSTIAAGLVCRFSRSDAARYSFLLATPIILGAGAKKALDILTGGVTLDSQMTQALMVGFLTALISGYVSIAFLLRLVRQYRLYGFAIYCVIFGSLSLIAALIRG